jgi:hypothetical protein
MFLPRKSMVVPMTNLGIVSNSPTRKGKPNLFRQSGIVQCTVVHYSFRYPHEKITVDGLQPVIRQHGQTSSRHAKGTNTPVGQKNQSY